jgi:aminoglycoside 3-N-acetyltransferase I
MASLAPLVIAKRLDECIDMIINQSIADARTARASMRAKHVACVGLLRPSLSRGASAGGRPRPRAGGEPSRLSRPMAAATLIVRRLGADDVELLRGLNALFAVAFGEQETYLAAPPIDDYLRDLLAKEHIVALVALAEGVILGGLVAYELDKFERMRRELYIYDLAVAEEHRRRGVATALIEHLREIAAQRGAWVIFIQADLGDEPAIALYDKLGAREDVLHFDIAPTKAR